MQMSKKKSSVMLFGLNELLLKDNQSVFLQNIKNINEINDAENKIRQIKLEEIDKRKA